MSLTASPWMAAMTTRPRRALLAGNPKRDVQMRAVIRPCFFPSLPPVAWSQCRAACWPADVLACWDDTEDEEASLTVNTPEAPQACRRVVAGMRCRCRRMDGIAAWPSDAPPAQV